MPTSQEMRVDKTFNGAMDQINRLQKVFRDEGGLAKAVVDVGGSQDFGAIQEAFDNLYGALEDAHYDAMAGIEVEAVKQKLGYGLHKYVKEDPSKPNFPMEIELAGDSIWDRDEPNPKTVTVTDYNMDKDEEGYVSVTVQHDGPWTVYTDTGFEKAISEMIGMEVSFSEQGMQQDGIAHLEGGDAMESVTESACGCGSSCSCDGACTSSCNCGPSCDDTSQADIELAMLKRNAGL
tara:strand:+ start:280 stop:984 length:705 start_codon:yes stop_codon:yes gene_type:complete